jgi:hypothetical protein
VRISLRKPLVLLMAHPDCFPWLSINPHFHPLTSVGHFSMSAIAWLRQFTFLGRPSQSTICAINERYGNNARVAFGAVHGHFLGWCHGMDERVQKSRTQHSKGPHSFRARMDMRWTAFWDSDDLSLLSGTTPSARFPYSRGICRNVHLSVYLPEETWTHRTR